MKNKTTKFYNNNEKSKYKSVYKEQIDENDKKKFKKIQININSNTNFIHKIVRFHSEFSSGIIILVGFITRKVMIVRNTSQYIRPNIFITICTKFQ